MKWTFFKYQGTGNDFIIIDNRSGLFPKSKVEMIQRYCDRRFGIGADGLMLLEDSEAFDFEMVYFNADGHKGSMCGNGARCIVRFAQDQGIIEGQTKFLAMGDPYSAQVDPETVTIGMQPVDSIEVYSDHLFLDTGSPHHIQYVEDVEKVDVFKDGRALRYGEPYGQVGTNVNFVQQIDGNTFRVRTYERGVENETLSCGTGVTAVALASYHKSMTQDQQVKIETQGGTLKVDFSTENDRYTNIHLSGPAEFVFKGELDDAIL